MSDLDKVLEYVIKCEDGYYDWAAKEMDKNNILGNHVCAAQASAFQRVRYFIENLKENSNE